MPLDVFKGQQRRIVTERQHIVTEAVDSSVHARFSKTEVQNDKRKISCSHSLDRNGKIFGMSNLYRSSDEKVIAGVCAGLAHKLDFNVSGLRWVVALVTLFLSGIPAIVYIILWAILKPRPTGGVIDV